jgi:hypothetical protein
LVVVVLLIFVAIDVFGLLTGRLTLSPSAFAPVLAAFFVRPWPIGVLWGFVVIGGIDLIGTLVATRSYRGAYLAYAPDELGCHVVCKGGVRFASAGTPRATLTPAADTRFVRAAAKMEEP